MLDKSDYTGLVNASLQRAQTQATTLNVGVAPDATSNVAGRIAQRNAAATQGRASMGSNQAFPVKSAAYQR